MTTYYFIAQGTLLKALCDGGDICVHIADPLCCTAETNNSIVKQLNSNKGKKERALDLLGITQHSLGDIPCLSSLGLLNRLIPVTSL